jgi:NADH dehydrogenase (ubiquinone) Fe-S protein 2
VNRSFFFSWNSFKRQNKNKIILNFGPQHPAAHGVLRLVLQLEGEIIQKTDIHIGLLHRGTEFLMETKHYEKSIPYFDRLDYCSMITQEHGYILAIEKLLNISNINYNVCLVRILFDELTRLLNHFLAIACHALDIGSMSSIFWAFEEREKLMEFYERASGARMHAAFHKPVILTNNFLTNGFLSDILFFINNCFVTLNEMHNVLSYNKIWKQRLVNIGTINQNNCSDYNLTGVMARSTGIKQDIRLSKFSSYSSYNSIIFNSYIGTNGDCYDRYLLRMMEMGESLHILNLVIQKLNISSVGSNSINVIWDSLFKSNNKMQYSSMEDLINHFLSWHTGLHILNNMQTSYIESPKGEFGVSIVSNNTTTPLRCKIKSPSYFNLQFLPNLSKGHYLADLAAIIGTIDIVFGEVDR